MPAKLVAIGDSLTQGFQHGAIRRTQWSYPAMVARVLGASGVDDFRQPDFSGGADDVGGPLVDLEHLTRSLGKPRNVDLISGLGTLWGVHSYLSRLEDYWERGGGADPSPTGPLHHNLAVWGFEVSDATTITDGVCLRNMTLPDDNFVDQVPEHPMYRTARRVLNPAHDVTLEELSQVDAAAAIAEREGGIENLVVALGANNALSTCLMLRIKWSESADNYRLAHQRSCTLWQPEHFDRAYEALVARVAAIDAKRVFLGTVPHVTIAPVSRGISPRAAGDSRIPHVVDDYYEFYSHFWVWDGDFHPDRHARLTREDARMVNAVIDAYNATIRAAAKRHGWHVIDICGLLDGLAFRHTHGRPTRELPHGLVDALARNPDTAFRVRPDGTVLIDTRFFRIPEKKPHHRAKPETWQHAYKGGIFGLDGVHPTTIGYGVMADEVLATMKRAKVPGADPAKLPWDEIVAADTLVTEPPPMLATLQRALGLLLHRAKLEGVIKRLSGRLLEL